MLKTPAWLRSTQHCLFAQTVQLVFHTKHMNLSVSSFSVRICYWKELLIIPHSFKIQESKRKILASNGLESAESVVNCGAAHNIITKWDTCFAWVAFFPLPYSAVVHCSDLPLLAVIVRHSTKVF